jgi:hypothetical protein
LTADLLSGQKAWAQHGQTERQEYNAGQKSAVEIVLRQAKTRALNPREKGNRSLACALLTHRPNDACSHGRIKVEQIEAGTLATPWSVSANQ